MNEKDIKILKKSVENYGTPQYILSEEDLKNRIHKLKEFFEKIPRTRFFYPYKTNDLPQLCKIIHNEGIYADVSSLMELKLALKLGVSKILLNGPKKSDEALKMALRNSEKVTLIVDSLSELNTILKLSEERINIGIRLNLRSRKGKRWEKFGIKPERVLEKKIWNKNVNLKGFHFHGGSEIKNPKIWENGLEEVGNLIKSMPTKERKSIDFIDVGGGFPSEGYSKASLIEILENLSNKQIPLLDKFFSNKTHRDIQMGNFFDSIIDEFEEEILSIKNIEKPHLCLEPGRWLINPCVHLLTKVIDRKDVGAILDGGINLVPHIIYEKHPVYNISQYSEDMKNEKLYGNLCMSKDLLSKSFKGEKLSEGNLIYIKNIGAYSISESWQFIKPKAKVVLMKEGETKIIRREENFQDRYGRDKLL